MSSPRFVNVATARAGSGSTSVPNLGTFAPLAGPVVGPEGHVYLGSLEGKVFAFNPDGTPKWETQLADEQQIFSPPAVAGNGSVYVVGVRLSGNTGPNAVPTVEPRVNLLNPGSGASFSWAFPTHLDRATNVGAPAIWEVPAGLLGHVIMVPVLYRDRFGNGELWLLAFAVTGTLLHEVLVSRWTPGAAVGGGWSDVWDLLGAEFRPGHFVPFTLPPYPGVAIGSNPPQWIAVCDRPNSKVWGFTFGFGPHCAPNSGCFTPQFETPHAPRGLWSAPVFRLDTHTIVGTDQSVVFSGTTELPEPPVPSGLAHVYATPTIAAGARPVIIDVVGNLVALHQNGAVSTRLQVPGRTIASAAASRTHVFVATTQGLYTLDAAASTITATFPWVDGGLWSPAIGPQGHVYAMAANILFVFPPPRTVGGGGAGVDLDNPTF